MTPEQFVRRFKGLAQIVRTRAPGILRDSAVEVVGEVAEATPVLTGHAASNWNASQGRPDTRVRKHRGPPSEAAAEAIERAERALPTQPTGAIFIVNGVPYIRALDAGRSPKASAGFVQRAVQRARRRVRRQRLLRLQGGRARRG